MRQYLAFATALAASLVMVMLTGCGSKGPLTLPPPQKTLALPTASPPAQALPAKSADDVNTTLQTNEKQAR